VNLAPYRTRGTALLLFSMIQAAALLATDSTLTIATKAPDALLSVVRWDAPSGDTTYDGDSILCTKLNPRGTEPFGTITYKKNASIPLPSPAQVECKVINKKVDQGDVFKLRLKDGRGNLLELYLTMAEAGLKLKKVNPIKADGTPRTLTEAELANFKSNVAWAGALNSITVNHTYFFEADDPAPATGRSRSGAAVK